MSYAIVEIETGQVLTEFHDVQPPGIVHWPNGDASCAVYPGLNHGLYRFVSVVHTPDSPGEFYRVTDVTPSLTGDTLTFQRTWMPIEMPIVRTILKERIDNLAEQERQKYITIGFGQSLTYQEKINEAKSCLADSNPTEKAYPMLAASIGYDGDSVSAVAKIVMDRYSSWTVLGSSIERTRIAGKRSIDMAKSVDDAMAAYESLVWSSL